ncbi:eCIS core domain-containing protein [Sorangium sp. So ce388]|uniref:eCIS core domain-containing protein n=1 Tax=Sorangium sp. So ce388 TaxID=3133309 RepID=UPI003F5B9FDA
MPHLEQIQSAFGRHDVRNVKARIGTAAADASRYLQAEAYTVGDSVGFASSPDLRLAAHEAAHTVQQQAGVHLAGDETRPGDRHERQADEVADAVASGRSAEALLDQIMVETHEGASTRVPQQRAVQRPIVQRQTAPGDPNPSAGAAPSVSLFRVEVVPIEDYEAASGLPASMLPEGQMVSPALAGLTTSPFMPTPAPENQCRITPGLGAGALMTPMVSSPFPFNSMGVLWEGSHLSIFANSRGELTTYGFRAGLPRHIASAAERLVGWKTGPMTTSLNQGVPGSFANDALFPYMPQSEALARSVTAEEAAAFAETLRQRSYNQTYRFSPPPEGSPAFMESFPAGVCPGGGTNCLNVPEAEILTATGGRRLVVETPAGPLDIATGIGGDSRGLEDVGRARRMTAMMEQVPPPSPETGGFGRVPVGRAMLGRGAVGVIRAGGVVLIVYGAYHTFRHLSEAPPEALPAVIGQETGSWVGGILGSALGGAAGGAIFCSPTGPVTFACAAAGFVGGAFVGAAGAIAGGIIGESVGDYAGRKLDEGHRWLDWNIRQLYGVPF